jgi:MazG family protein
MPDTYGFRDLVEIMDRLRDPGGCPWDREQTYSTLRGYLLEECYEVVEAIDRLDGPALREELGDLLFQIVFLARLAKERDWFVAEDVVREIAAKMVRRHPHVFGDAKADTPDEVLDHWEAIKIREKQGNSDEAGAADTSVLAGVPRALPALMKAYRLGTKAARVGFDWERDRDVLGKLDEELAELRRAVESGDRPGIREEVGDLLFTLAMLARRLGIDPEEALERANLKFQTRFREVEREVGRRGLKLSEAGLELMDRLWNQAKGEVDHGDG